MKALLVVILLAVNLQTQPAHRVYLPFVAGGMVTVSTGPVIAPPQLTPGPRGCLFICP